MSVLNFTDLTACANKQRQSGYWHVAPSIITSGEFESMPALVKTWIPNTMSIDCKYDRKAVDPACAKANCGRVTE